MLERSSPASRASSPRCGPTYRQKSAACGPARTAEVLRGTARRTIRPDAGTGIHGRPGRRCAMPEQQPAGAYGGGPAIPAKKVTVPDIVQMKRDGKKITMMTAYDVAFARLVDQAGIDITLVGDSLGMVMLGYTTTVPVTMDDMVRHAAAVARGTKRALLVGDMPFGAYQTGRDDAIRNATRFLKEAGTDAIKLEGGHEVAETVRALVE